MIDLVAGFHLEQPRGLVAGGFASQENDLGLVTAAAGADLVGDVLHLEQRGLRLVLGDEGADALNPDQLAFQRELPQRPVDGHPADPDLADQFGLRGDAVAGPPVAGLDPDEIIRLIWV